ncbi:PQQ-dependent sugar dehydrogenase [Streptomyces sp. NPDC047072]|uniref:PQQ-dependent sugar dehydrogenase n=1 Tax=Streptomyces sp. NPDC047072 TaxID=3154809 RepID=UPI0033F97BF2
MAHARLTRAFATTLAIGIGLTACTTADAPAPRPATGSVPSFSGSPGVAMAPTGTPREVATGLGAPWSVVFIEGTPLVSERDTGRILELDGSGRSRVVGTIDGVAHGGEGGVLGLAVDGRSRLYVYSTGQDGNRIERYALSGSPGFFTLGSGKTILDGLPSASYHNGGRIAFGPDGMLYAGVGDAGNSSSAQDLDALSGKILRMTPDGGVPDDNPFPDSLVYSYGHRNVQGLAWTTDGTMFATEFGQGTWDELNIIRPGGNYGWPTAEGRGGDEDFIDPVQQWSPADASPSGLLAVEGTLFIANLRGQVLRAVPLSDLSTSTEYYKGEYGRIRAVALAPDGALWFLTNNTDGHAEPRSGDDRIVRVELGAGRLSGS